MLVKMKATRHKTAFYPLLFIMCNEKKR